jgi:DNA polymerase I-like protein with 3'-5' exonuclease and polymerase domains
LSNLLEREIMSSKKYLLVVSSPLKENVKAGVKPYSGSIEFDIVYLSSQPREKILKKDIDLDFSVFENYDVVCPVGAEALKHVCNLSGVVKYNGVVVEGKYVPIIDPSMLFVKPQYENELIKAFNTLSDIDNDVVKIFNDKYYEHFTDIDSFRPYLQKMRDAEVIAIDTETSSLSPRKGNIIGFVFSTEIHEGVYVDPDVIEYFFDDLYEIFMTTKCVFHNAKFDIAFIKHDFGFVFPDFEDTMLLHYCLDESIGSHGLKQLALKFTDLGDYDKELEEYKKTWCRQNKIKMADFNYSMIPNEILSSYGCKDGDATIQLFHKFMPIVQKNKQFTFLYEKILKPATMSITHLENVGGPISIDILDSLIEDYKIDIEETINELAFHPAIQEFESSTGKTFNPNSVFHLREVLFNILQLKPVKKTETGAYSTDAEVLQSLGHPVTEAVLDLRKKVKLSQTYLKNIKEGVDHDGRLRSSFNVTGTTSGRLSSSGVLNYQNLPRDKDSGIKRIFRAAEGYSIVQADLGTAEVYVAAALSGDKFLQQAFINKLDFHSYVAKNMFKLDCEVNQVKDLYSDMRQYSKAITFGILYGAGPSKIAETANISVPEAKEFIAKYFREAKTLKQWIDDSLEFIEDNSFIYSAFGRKRRLPEVTAPNKAIAKHASRSGLNFLIQSVASDINLLGIIDATNWVKEQSLEKEIKLFATVHDSVIAEVHNDYIPLYAKMLKQCLQKDRGVFIKNCPITVDIEVGPSWGELSDYTI